MKCHNYEYELFIVPFFDVNLLIIYITYATRVLHLIIFHLVYFFNVGIAIHISDFPNTTRQVLDE